MDQKQAAAVLNAILSERSQNTLKYAKENNKKPEENTEWSRLKGNIEFLLMPAPRIEILGCFYRIRMPIRNALGSPFLMTEHEFLEAEALWKESLKV